jgi:hypothetical protein
MTLQESGCENQYYKVQCQAAAAVTAPALARKLPMLSSVGTGIAVDAYSLFALEHPSQMYIWSKKRYS